MSPWFHCGSQQGAEHISRQKEHGNMETFRKINLMDFILLMLFWKDAFEVTNTQYRCKQWGREAVSLSLLPVLKLLGPHPNSSHLTLAIPKTVFIHSCFETAKREIWVELCLAWGCSCFNQRQWIKMFVGMHSCEENGGFYSDPWVVPPAAQPGTPHRGSPFWSG